MQYHRGLLHQRGHGWGALAKIAAKVAAPVVAQVVGGLLGGAQTGHGTNTAPEYDLPTRTVAPRLVPRANMNT